MISIAIITQKAFKESYQVKRLLEEFKDLGTLPVHISMEDIVIQFNTTKAQIYYYDASSKTLQDLLQFDAYFFREVFSQMKNAINIATWLKQKDATVIDNNLTKVNYLNNKIQEGFELTSAQVPFIPTLNFADKEVLFKNLDYLETSLGGYPIIAKKRGSGKGMGIWMLKSRQELIDLIENTIATHRFGREVVKLFLFQKFIRVKEEYRVFVVNNKVIAAMQRIPKQGDFRANYSQGGTVRPAKVTKAMESLSLKAAKATQAIIAGVDYAITHDGKEYIFEVNRTPGFKGLEEATGINVARILAEYVLSQTL